MGSYDRPCCSLERSFDSLEKSFLLVGSLALSSAHLCLSQVGSGHVNAGRKVRSQNRIGMVIKLSAQSEGSKHRPVSCAGQWLGQIELASLNLILCSSLTGVETESGV